MGKTDIALIADISTEGRTREQIDAQLRQKIYGFDKEALRRYKPLGYSLREAQVFEKEPGKCILTTEPVESADALKLQEALGELLSKITWPKECDPSEPFAIFEQLVEELVDIGCSTYHYAGGPSNFWLPKDGAKKNPRVVEIGRELYRLGNKMLEKMREAADRVSSALGPVATDDLSHHWHEIGLEQYQQEQGECWLA